MFQVESTDPRFGSCSSPPCCLSFTRSAPVCNSTPRNQLNEQTAFIDGSQIYAFNSKMYLPFNQQTCSGPSSCPANFDAGDNRITIFVGLVAFHTLFLREHNRLVEKLQQINPHWGKDRIYE
uniref:Peroxidase n=1 Tax=Romanomermis culicivorax TaxID=13658 RepID=A0A915KTR8_ROMCU